MFVLDIFTSEEQIEYKALKSDIIRHHGEVIGYDDDCGQVTVCAEFKTEADRNNFYNIMFDHVSGMEMID